MLLFVLLADSTGSGGLPGLEIFKLQLDYG